MKIKEIINGMTLQQKVAMLQGWSTWTTYKNEDLGIPSMFLSDGPVGLRKQAGAGDHLGLNESVPATCFPTAATMANSWDVELGVELGRTLGKEAAANDVHVVLGPGLPILRVYRQTVLPPVRSILRLTLRSFAVCLWIRWLTSALCVRYTSQALKWQLNRAGQRP